MADAMLLLKELTRTNSGLINQGGGEPIYCTTAASYPRISVELAPMAGKFIGEVGDRSRVLCHPGCTGHHIGSDW